MSTGGDEWSGAASISPMSNLLQFGDDLAFLDQCLDDVKAGLARYGQQLVRPVVNGRADLDRMGYLVLPAEGAPPQLWLYTGVDASRRRGVIAQAVAALVVFLLEPDSPEPFKAERWKKVMLHLKQNPDATPVLAIGAPPPPAQPATKAVTPRHDSAESKQDATGLKVKWLTSEGIRPLPISEPFPPKEPLTEADEREPAARMLQALLKPRARVCWTHAGAGGLVAIIDPEQLKVKTAFLDAVSDRAPCGDGEIPLRRCIKVMLRERDHLQGDALLMFGCPAGSTQAQLVAACGVWRVGRRVLDQIQYEVSIEFLWANSAHRGAYRKLMSATAAQALADELARICSESSRGGKASSVVAKVYGKPQLEFEWTGMTNLVSEFRRRCKKSRGGVHFGGMLDKVTKPKSMEA